MGIKENIAHHLREYKNKRGLSVDEMAEELNIGRGTIQKCLHKQGNPELDTLLYLANRMGMPPEELFMPWDYQRIQRENTKIYLLELKQILEDVQ